MKRRGVEKEESEYSNYSRKKEKKIRTIDNLNFKTFQPINNQLWEHMSQYQEFPRFHDIIVKIFKRKSIGSQEYIDIAKFISEYITDSHLLEKKIKGWESFPNHEEEIINLFPDLDKEYIKENVNEIAKFSNTILVLMNCVPITCRKTIFMNIAAKVEGKVDHYIFGGSQSNETTIHEQIFENISGNSNMHLEVVYLPFRRSASDETN